MRRNLQDPDVIPASDLLHRHLRIRTQDVIRNRRFRNLFGILHRIRLFFSGIRHFFRRHRFFSGSTRRGNLVFSGRRSGNLLAARQNSSQLRRCSGSRFRCPILIVAVKCCQNRCCRDHQKAQEDQNSSPLIFHLQHLCGEAGPARSAAGRRPSEPVPATRVGPSGEETVLRAAFPFHRCWSPQK